MIHVNILCCYLKQISSLFVVVYKGFHLLFLLHERLIKTGSINVGSKNRKGSANRKHVHTHSMWQVTVYLVTSDK